jgi:hypothetical protein
MGKVTRRGWTCFFFPCDSRWRQVKFIYINRGYRANDWDDSFKVFSCPCHKTAEIHQFTKCLIETVESKDEGEEAGVSKQAKIRDFHNQQVQHQLSTQKIPAEFKFRDQKTGNCPFANSNVSLRFMMAAEKVQQSPSQPFFEAAQEVRPAYKQEMKKDRLNAIIELLELAKQHPANNQVNKLWFMLWLN